MEIPGLKAEEDVNGRVFAVLFAIAATIERPSTGGACFSHGPDMMVCVDAAGEPHVERIAP